LTAGAAVSLGRGSRGDGAIPWRSAATPEPMTAPSASPRRLPGYLAALTAVSIWAGWIPVLRFGVVGHLHAEDIAAIRYGVSAFLLLPLFVHRRRELPWRRAGLLLLLVVGAGVPYQLLFAHGVAIANSGQAAVVGPGLVSALVTLFAALLLRERPGRAQLIGLGVTLGGVAAVVLHGAALGGGRLGGLLLIMAGSVLWATYTTVSRALRLEPLTNAAAVACLNAAFYLPYYVAGGGLGQLAAIPGTELWLQVIYQGVLTAVVALVAFAIAVNRLGAASAASFTPLVPVFATVFGWLLLRDRVDWATAIGLGAVAAGVLIANGRAAGALISRR
jgi:drug/metabolite transporter (DMT)-like permease